MTKLAEIKLQGDLKLYSGLILGEMSNEKHCLLMLHGWLDNAASFVPLLNVLSCEQEKGHLPDTYALAIDLPGHGHFLSHNPIFNHVDTSALASIPSFSFHDYIDDIYQIINLVEAKSITLVGHSLGGLISASFCAAFPEKISGLILIDVLAPLFEDEEQAAYRLRQGILSRHKHKGATTYLNREDALEKRMQRNGLTKEEIQPIIDRGMYFDHGSWRWSHHPSLLTTSLYRMSFAQVKTYLQAIQCPCLAILAEDGLVMEMERVHVGSMQKIIDLYHELTINWICGGHHCHLQSPQQVLQQLMKFYQNKINDRY